jgi:hypothetical protein
MEFYYWFEGAVSRGELKREDRDAALLAWNAALTAVRTNGDVGTEFCECQSDMITICRGLEA